MSGLIPSTRLAMGSKNSSSGWFKQAEQIEQERKSGSVPPPVQRTLARPPVPTPQHPVEVPPSEAPPPPAETPPAVANAAITTVEKRPITPPAVETNAADAPKLPAPVTTTARVTPAASVTIPDLPDPATRSVMRSPFHKPPPSFRRTEVALPRPEVKPSPASAVSPPASGRFSLVPDGAGHRLVFAKPGETTAGVPVVINRLAIPELRQLAATLARYLGAIDPNGAPGTVPEICLDKPVPPTDS